MDRNKDTREILSKIRSIVEYENSIKDGKPDMITEEVFDKSKMDDEKEFPINKNTPQFGDIRQAQEDTLIKTLGERVELDNNALIYYPQNKDLVLNGKVTSLNLAFQFRYNDPSGEGCYLWANAMQLSDANSRVIGKLRDAFLNWKQNLVQNGDLLDKLHKAASEE